MIAARCTACRSRSRTWSTWRACRRLSPRARAARAWRSRTRRWCATCAGPAPSSSARPTCSNTPMARSIRISVRPTIHGIRAARLGGPAVARRQQWRRASVSPRSAPTPADRSASPPSYCGAVGLKPTFGRVSLDGVQALSPSLDHAGPLTRSSADAAITLGAMMGEAVHSPRAELRGLRVGIMHHPGAERFLQTGDPGARSIRRSTS